MKMLILTAAALGLATPALAQDQPATPPAADEARQNAAATDLPVCSRTVTDKCVQRGAKMAHKAAARKKR